jgi:hypothetical protein
MLDAEALAEMLAPIIAEEVEKATAPLLQRIGELEARPVAEKGEKGEPGERGSDGIAPDAETVAAALFPATEEMVAREVATAIAALPPPQRGEKGEPGARGDPGENGSDGRDGSDGRGVKDLLIDRGGNLVATMDDGEMKSLGPVVGADGKKGKDGRDGFSLEDFDIEPGEDGRTYTLKFQQGEAVHKFELSFPCPVYCGVWKEDEEYVPGDLTTWGGSTWHCNRTSPGKPDTKDSGWQLMVKKGRDGKDAARG